MDMSKLPRLSNTRESEPQQPPAPATNQPAPQVVERIVYVEQATAAGPEAWISAAQRFCSMVALKLSRFSK